MSTAIRWTWCVVLCATLGCGTPSTPEPDAGTVETPDSGETTSDGGAPDGGDTCVPSTETCTGGGDEDCDGLVDCADPDCEGQLCRAADGACDREERCTAGLCPADAVTPHGWRELTGLPTPKLNPEVQVASGRLWIAGGGTASFQDSPEVWSRPILADGSLGEVRVEPQLSSSFATELVTDGRWLFAIGGCSDGMQCRNVTNEIRVLDTTAATREWTVAGRLPNGPLYGAAAVVWNGRLVLFGGAGAPESASSESWVATIGSDGGLSNWVEGPSLGEPRAFHAAVLVPELARIIVAGGCFNGAVFCRNVHQTSLGFDTSGTTVVGWGQGSGPESLGGSLVATSGGARLFGGTTNTTGRVERFSVESGWAAEPNVPGNALGLAAAGADGRVWAVALTRVLVAEESEAGDLGRVVCRVAAGACDVAEFCDGTTKACPANAPAFEGQLCRSGEGPCDAEEYCDGTSFDCPVDALQLAGTSCRPAEGPCDAEDLCDGTTPDCADLKLPRDTVCRPAAGECDVEDLCDGEWNDCLDSMSDHVCRPSTGACDPEERCSGFDPMCPEDVLAGPEVVCRESAGPCDLPEVCQGFSTTCGLDLFAEPGEVCEVGAGLLGMCGGDASCPN